MESEAHTRSGRIDPRLARAKWDVQPFDDALVDHKPERIAVEEWPTAAGPADYAFCSDNYIYGVAEAKKLTIGPEGVLTQAARYSRGIDQRPRYQDEYGVPFLYSSNGERHFFQDVRHAKN